jgi:nickel superoxide dismutase
MVKTSKILSILFIFTAVSSTLWAHCQIPCGIFSDKMRFDMLREHITTIEKSMNQINDLSGDTSKNMNQLVRWVNNKDQHADEFTEIVTYYFLAQRIKMVDKSDAGFADYQQKVTVLHQMMVYAMKCKQTTDLENVNKLKSLVNGFEEMYFTEDDQKHLKDHK